MGICGRSYGIRNYFPKKHKDKPLATCRAVFVPTMKTDRIWSGSGINAHAHIQICVRNPACIMGTWLVQPMEEEHA